MKPLVEGERARYGWWALVLATAVILAYIGYRFVGTFVFSLFLYYAVRPANTQIRRVLDSRTLAAALTMLLIVIPLLALLGYVGFIALREVSTFLASDGVRALLAQYVDVDVDALTADPSLVLEYVDRIREPGPINEAISTTVGLLGALSNALIHIAIMMATVFYLLRDAPRLHGWFRDLVGRDSAAYAYALAADADLRSVYFGNVITVVMITSLSIIWYNVYNAIAPSAVSLPVPTLLALLTGIASMIPLIVGKVVYLPATAWLVVGALRTNTELVWYPVGFVIVAFLFLDFVPQTFIQPMIAGRNLHIGLMVFAYIFGGIIFGWYGLFLGPLLLVLMIHTVRFALTPLLRGHPVTQAPTAAEDIGSDPALER